MQIQENISLKPYNTFGIDARARYFARFNNKKDLGELLYHNTSVGAKNMSPVFILGGGSNILFKKNFDGIIARNEVMGIKKTGEDDDNIYIRAGAGENWHGFVTHCITNGWAGIENLSLIPGCVGASPMQNIGAYGVELSEVFYELDAFHLGDKINQTFSLKDCGFGYRDSVFKNKYNNQFAILSVTYQLKKKPEFHTEYGAVRQELERMGVTDLSIRAISEAIIHIRQSKLPDPKVIGNAGSYFKNPVISKEQFVKLRQQFENVIGHEMADGNIKLAAGWLIEHCGPALQENERGFRSWKGFRRGDAGCHTHQALVLVNYGNATGEEIYKLGEEIRLSVKEKFAVDLEREVNIL